MRLGDGIAGELVKIILKFVGERLYYAGLAGPAEGEASTKVG